MFTIVPDNIVHMPCYAVAVFPRVVHQGRSSDSAQGAQRAEASGTASNHDNIVVDLWNGLGHGK